MWMAATVKPLPGTQPSASGEGPLGQGDDGARVRPQSAGGSARPTMRPTTTISGLVRW